MRLGFKENKKICLHWDGENMLNDESFERTEDRILVCQIWMKENVWTREFSLLGLSNPRSNAQDTPSLLNPMVQIVSKI